MIQSILSNVSVILLSHLLIMSLLNYKERFTKLTIRISIIVILSATIISMFYLPIYFGEYRFDLRLIPLIMLVLFNGWPVALPVLVIAASWRLVIGGDGALPGIIFGMTLPTLFALLYVKKIKRQPKIRDIIVVVTICWFISDFPIIFYVPNSIEVLKQAFGWRYTSFLVVTFIYYIVIKLDHKNLAMKEELRFLATHDQLTKLLTKQECIRLAEKNRESKAKQTTDFIAMIDLDHFKKLNDAYGHIAGDEALVQMANILASFENEKLLVARYGGEEFMIYLEATNKAEAVERITHIQNKIRKKTFSIQQATEVSITVSIGIAKWEENDSVLNAIRKADQNLYLAKNRGRDQIVANG